MLDGFGRTELSSGLCVNPRNDSEDSESLLWFTKAAKAQLGRDRRCCLIASVSLPGEHQMDTDKSQRNASKSARPQVTPGVIRADEVYRKDEFLRRAGMKQAGYRTATRNGLRTIFAGRVWVRGADFIDYLAQVASAASPDPAATD